MAQAWPDWPRAVETAASEQQSHRIQTDRFVAFEVGDKDPSISFGQ